MQEQTKQNKGILFFLNFKKAFDSLRNEAIFDAFKDIWIQTRSGTYNINKLETVLKLWLVIRIVFKGTWCWSCVVYSNNRNYEVQY